MSNLHNNPHLELPPQQIPQPQRVQQPQLEQQQPQPEQQQQIASMYPKIPSQDELPGYSPYPYPAPPQAQQPPQQYIQQPLYPQYNQQQQPCMHHHEQQPPQQQAMYYGSIPAPNISSPAPTQPQNSQQAFVVHPTNSLKTKSKLVQCPHCQQLIYTVLDYDAGLCTGLSIAGLFFAGCNNGLCLLPWLFPWTKDVTHQCPSCKEKIATFTRLERDTRVLAPPIGL